MASYKEVYNRLYETAADQGGYFTARQAVAAGYADNTHPFHVRSGNWVREQRGVYRLAKYPLGDNSDLVLWCLWSRDRADAPQGVYSHETALAFHGLSDVNPAKLHMTVPPRFRRRSPIPEILVLHRGTVPEEDADRVQGFRVTRPLRTLADLLAARTVQLDHMEQAVKQAFKRGLVTREQVRGAVRIAGSVKREIERLNG